MTDLEGVEERLARIALAAREEEMVEFGFGTRWEEAVARLEELFANLEEQVSSYARVRSEAAMTVVGWSGNMKSVWVNPARAAEHWKAVREQLERRARLVRILAAGTRTLAAVSAAMASPLYVVSAVRAAWMLVGELEALEKRGEG